MGKGLFPPYTPPPSTQDMMNARNTKIEAQNEATKPAKVGGGTIQVPTTSDPAANKNIADAVAKMSQIEKIDNAMENKTGGRRRTLRRRRRTLRRRRRVFRRRTRR